MRFSFTAPIAVVMVAYSSDAVAQPTIASADASRPAQAPMSPKAQIDNLKRRGLLPKLDRSSSIAGPDANNNGVRDDIEAVINGLNLTAGQRKAALQKAKTLQATLTVNSADKAAVQAVGDALMASTNCLGDQFTSSEAHSEMSQRIEAMTANTRERVTQYLKFNAASSGSVTRLPDGNTCE